MNEFILTRDQADQTVGVEGPVTVRNDSGEIVGHFHPFSAAEKRDIDDIKSRLAPPHVNYTKAQFLHALESRTM